jgi:alpha-N-arabinofuranosidase
MADDKQTTTIDVFPSSVLGTVSDGLFGGFLEHLGRCIYGGILPATPTSFPHTSGRPCAPEQFEHTPAELLAPEGWRADVLAVLRDELRVSVVRWPGGNYVSSYHWQDGVGPQEERRVRPELAWGAEESNAFGTNECALYRLWCQQKI